MEPAFESDPERQQYHLGCESSGKFVGAPLLESGRDRSGKMGEFQLSAFLKFLVDRDDGDTSEPRSAP